MTTRTARAVLILSALIGGWSKEPADSGSPGGEGVLSEGFDHASIASRGWYDLSTPTVTTAENRTGPGSLQVRWTSGSTSPIGAMPMLFILTDTIYLSY